jgi:hypothetical protein
MKRSLIIALTVSAFYSCSSGAQSSSSNTYAEDMQAVKRLDASNGINKDQAYLITRAFFWTNISGCGFPFEPEDKGQFWVSKTAVGYAGAPAAPIYVDKRTGAVSWDKKGKQVSLNELKQWKPQ